MEADKESLAQQLATVNVDPNDGKASEVDEVSTGTGKKKNQLFLIQPGISTFGM